MVVRDSARGRVLCCAVRANPLPLPGGRFRPRRPPNTTSPRRSERAARRGLKRVGAGGFSAEPTPKVTT